MCESESAKNFMLESFFSCLKIIILKLCLELRVNNHFSVCPIFGRKVVFFVCFFIIILNMALSSSALSLLLQIDG